MAGILGLLHRDGKPVDQSLLERMSTALSHRGPDGSMAWVDGFVGLGHLKLVTTPESGQEMLPVASSDKNRILTCDARIDNRSDLERLLGIEKTEALSDGELILRAYEKWGKGCTSHLMGAFAFAIWDSRSQSIFCGRDHFGVKPFYYYLNNRIFAFASEIKALLVIPEVPRKLNETKIGDYLAGYFEDTVSTYYEGISRLEAATQLVVGQGREEKVTYWQLDRGKEIRLKSDEAYAEAFRDVFREAVRCRMRSVEPVGSLLSGGLDSSSVTCMARDLAVKSGSAKPHTFSSVFDTVRECDEREYIQKVINKGYLVPHFVSADKQSVLQTQLQTWMPGFEDEPLLASNLHVTWHHYAMAKKLGLNVMLDGFDGDTTISHGMGYFNELAQDGKWLSLYQEAQGYVKLHKGSVRQIMSNFLFRHVSWLRLLARVRRRVFRSARPARPGPLWYRLMNSDFAERIHIVERYKSANAVSKTMQEKERDHHYYLLSRGIMASTNELIDRASSFFGLETRFPFWDKRVVEFCLALPPEQKLSRGWSRMILRRSMEGILPKEIQWRAGKSNLSPGFMYVLKKYEKERVEQIFRDTPEMEAFIDLSTFRKAWKQFLGNTSTGEEANVLWKIVALQTWLNQVCDDSYTFS